MPGTDLHEPGSAAALGSAARGRVVAGTGAHSAFNDRLAGHSGSASGNEYITLHRSLEASPPRLTSFRAPSTPSPSHDLARLLLRREAGSDTYS